MRNRSIRFLRGWRGRVPGQTDAALDYGVKVALVQRRIAAWVNESAEHDSHSANLVPNRPANKGRRVTVPAIDT